VVHEWGLPSAGYALDLVEHGLHMSRAVQMLLLVAHVVLEEDIRTLPSPALNGLVAVKPVPAQVVLKQFMGLDCVDVSLWNHVHLLDLSTRAVAIEEVQEWQPRLHSRQVAGQTKVNDLLHAAARHDGDTSLPAGHHVTVVVLNG